MNRFAAGIALAAALLMCGAVAGDIQSGPKEGASVGPFHPLNVTGRAAGQKNCLVWSNGNNPVAMIFAREVSDNLTSLVKKIDAATVSNKSARMGSFVVFLSDDESLEGKLKTLAQKEGLKECVLTIDNPAGPKALNIAKDADVVVVLYKQKKVAANHAFKKGELKAADIDKIVADLSKIVPSK